MSEEIIKVLDYFADKLGIAIDWTTENVMPYIEEVFGKFVTYNVVKHSLLMLCGLVMIPMLFKFAKLPNKSKLKCEQTQKPTFFYDYNSYRKEAVEDEIGVILACIVFALMCVMCVLLIGCNINEVLQWSIIPEMALLEEIQCLINGV